MEPSVQEQQTIGLGRAVHSLLQWLPVSTTFIKFLIVGGIGYLVNQVVLFVVYDSPLLAVLPEKGSDFDLVVITHPDVRLLIASVAAVESAVISNFFFHERWTFRRRDRRSPVPVRFLKFNGMSIGSPLITFVAVNTMTPLLGVSPYIANTVGIGLGAIWNWVWNNYVIWPR